MLHDHYRILREAWAAHDGYEVSTEGDSFLVTFADPALAIAAGVAGQRAIGAHSWPSGIKLRVRMGIHTGDTRLHGRNYTGLSIHQASRVMSAAHGGQIMVSGATKDAVAGLPDEISFLDLGLHRLRDIDAPARLYQVTAPGLGETFPPPKTLTAMPNNFRLELTSFVGRKDDVAAVRGALAESRLVTLVGSGGVGKTRLAVRVATEMLDALTDGAWFVDLAGVPDPGQVAATAASALGIAEQPGRSLLDTLSDALLRRQTLLILDNCEHLIDACAQMADRILTSCADVKILATSREPLTVSGEAVWRVRSLTVPDEGGDLEAVLGTEAAELFAERAGAADPGFAITTEDGPAVGQICRRLDGMPLAIELAAARVRSMSVGELASRLDDRFRLLGAGSRTALPRQRTLEATVAWSYELLSAAERLLFDRLSVFAGGCTIEAAQDVCADGQLTAGAILEVVNLLADRSMLVVDKPGNGSTRYRMLETLRQFGRDRLAERGETENLRSRHLQWAIQLAEKGPPALGPAKQRPDAVREEQNLRAGLDWALERNDDEAALRIVSSVWFGHFNDRVPLFERLLPPSPSVPVDVAAQALFTGLGLAFMMGDWELGAQRGALGVEAARAAGNHLLLALCLSYQGMCAMGLGDDSTALRLAQEGLQVAQDAKLAEPEARALMSIAFLHLETDLDQAERHLRRAREVWDDMFTAGHVEEALGLVCCLRGQHQQAAGQLADAVGTFREIQANCGAHLLETCGAWAAATEQFELGAELVAAAQRIREETADKPRPNERLIHRDWLPRIPDNLDTETLDAARKRGRRRNFEEALDFAEANLRSYAA